MVYLPGRKGALAAEMSAAARRLGRMPYLLDGTMESLVTEVAEGRPVAVLLNVGHAVLPRWHYAVVIGYDGEGDEVLLHSGREKEKAMPSARFMRAWAGSGNWAMVAVAPGEAPATAERIPYFRQATALEDVGMVREAEAAWRRATELWPDDPTPHLGLGNTRVAQGRLAAAEEAFRSVLLRAPESVAGLNNLAHVLSLQGCHEEALLLIEKAVRLAAGTGLEESVAATRTEIGRRAGRKNGGGSPRNR